MHSILEETLAKAQGSVRGCRDRRGRIPRQGSLRSGEASCVSRGFRKICFQEIRYRALRFSCHGNPVHPDEAEAKSVTMTFLSTPLLPRREARLDTVITFSGCPRGKFPAIRCRTGRPAHGPREYLCEVLDYQWNDVLNSLLGEGNQICARNTARKPHVALELHPGFCVYNPEKLMKPAGCRSRYRC